MFYKNDDYKVWSANTNGSEQYFIQFYVQSGKSVVCEINADCFQLYIKEFNKPIERQKNERRRRRVSEVPYDALAQMPAADCDPADIAASKEDLSKVIEIVKSGTLTQRRRFYMRYIDGLTFSEIAAIENCDKSAVRRSINYILQKFK